MGARSSDGERSEAAQALGSPPRVLAILADDHPSIDGDLADALGVELSAYADLDAALDACRTTQPVDVVVVDASVADPEVALAALRPRLSPEPSWVVLAPGDVPVPDAAHVVRPPYGRRVVLVALMAAVIKAKTGPHASSTSDGIRSGIRRRPR